MNFETCMLGPRAANQRSESRGGFGAGGLEPGTEGGPAKPGFS